MKKTIFSTLILLATVLSACGTSQSNTPGRQNTSGNGELPEITKLVIGTLNLKDTENAVTQEQASELLPLWQVYLSLLSSDSAAQEEKDALAEQIGETMTSEQTSAIETMQLSQQDVLTAMQENGVGFGGGNRPQGNNGSGRNGGGFPGGGGGFPGGGDFGGGGTPGGGDFGGGNFTPPDGVDFQNGDLPEGFQGGEFPAQGIGGGGVPTPLIQAVIDYLQEIADS